MAVYKLLIWSLQTPYKEFVNSHIRSLQTALYGVYKQPYMEFTNSLYGCLQTALYGSLQTALYGSLQTALYGSLQTPYMEFTNCLIRSL